MFILIKLQNPQKNSNQNPVANRTCPGPSAERLFSLPWKMKSSKSHSVKIQNRAKTIIDWSPDTPFPLGTHLLPTPEATPDSLPLTSGLHTHLQLPAWRHLPWPHHCLLQSVFLCNRFYFPNMENILQRLCFLGVPLPQDLQVLTLIALAHSSDHPVCVELGVGALTGHLLKS